jgi:ADP-heptose:LPS heptosyltransferase
LSTPPRHLLVIRNSAMGDVAMTVPVLRLLLQQHPGLRVTVVSNSFFQPLFAGIDRLEFFPAHLKTQHKGFVGLFRVFKELKKKYDFDAVADLHNVLRTQIIRKFFLFSGIPVKVIDKGRKEKKELTRKDNKIIKQLPTTFERYAAVFEKMGLPINLNDPLQPMRFNQARLFVEQTQHAVGIAPFAHHAEKMYPAEKMKELIRLLLNEKSIQVYLFGGGKEEIRILDEWAKELPGIKSLAGKMDFESELSHISQLDLMVSMDSANMHLASLYGVPVVSIWGGTHPFAGFYGWRQSYDNAAQVELYCRPCSVFGNKPCYRGDLACMHELTPAAVLQKILHVLRTK